MAKQGQSGNSYDWILVKKRIDRTQARLDKVSNQELLLEAAHSLRIERERQKELETQLENQKQDIQRASTVDWVKMRSNELSNLSFGDFRWTRDIRMTVRTPDPLHRISLLNSSWIALPRRLRCCSSWRSKNYRKKSWTNKRKSKFLKMWSTSEMSAPNICLVCRKKWVWDRQSVKNYFNFRELVF